MSKYLLWFALLISCFTLSTFQSKAEVSVTITGASDYLFNGVSQTDEKPAIQGSIDWSNQHGWYVGSWASNVDFGEGTDAEIDYYGGFANNLNSDFSYDIGLAHYTYVGGDNSSDYNYTEIYFSLAYQSTQIKAWYTNDYAGTEAGHYIVALSHSLKLTEQVDLTLQVDRSTSLDEDRFSWDANDDSYLHAKAELGFSWKDIAFTLSAEKTDLDYDDDVKLLGTISYTFDL